MRIAVINSYFPPRAGGSAHLSEAIARHCVEAGHEVLVITSAFPDASQEEVIDGMRVVRLSSFAPQSRLAFNYDIPFAISRRNYRKMSALLSDFRPDVIHQHGQFFDLTWMSTFWARRHATPVVLSVHTRLISPSRMHGAILALGDLTVVRAMTRRSNPVVVAVDGPVHTYVRKRYSIPETRIVDIPVGIEPDRFRSDDGAAVRSRLGIGDRPMLLSLGHVIPLRDRLAIIEAMPLMLAEFPDLVVVVVGNVYDDRFQTRARELGVEHALVVTGGVPKDAVPGYAAAADVEAHDLQGIGFGTASLEMLAAGVPVVTNATVDNYPTARLIDGESVIRPAGPRPEDVAEAFLRLLRDPNLREAVSRGGQALARAEFSMDEVAKRHMELYEKVSGGSAAP
jgi:glycosyltransferase involved in cell wall biosynthesis